MGGSCSSRVQTGGRGQTMGATGGLGWVTGNSDSWAGAGTGHADGGGRVAMEPSGKLDKVGNSSVAGNVICRTAMMHAMAGIGASLLRGKQKLFSSGRGGGRSNGTSGRD